MDPNANLAEQRRIVARLMAAWDSDASTLSEFLDAIAKDAMRLAELVEALDGWISKGGFLPDAWARR